MSWAKPLTGRPDGSYALFRSNDKFVEVLSDATACRTIWFFLDDEVFIASTSQRAIVQLVGSFEFNARVVPWMLSSGTLGPGNSWDRRIHCVPADSSITLDRKAWSLRSDIGSCAFVAVDRSAEQHRALLEQHLQQTFSSLALDYSKWVLPLSGGFDSRLILQMLKHHANLRTVTWGLKSSLGESDNDAYIARSLANLLGLRHDFYETGLSTEPVNAVFDRFLICGEGRIDHISGYMDGFKIWKVLFEGGVEGVIRGDEGFGWEPALSPFQVRMAIELQLWSDFANVKERGDFGTQEIPTHLLQEHDESLETWRDRLYHQFRIPTVLAALSDLKVAYVEIVNPLLSNQVVAFVRTMPDHLRTSKNLFKSIVRSMPPQLDFAKYPAIDDPKNILRSGPAVAVLRDELSSAHAKALLPEDVLAYILSHLQPISPRTEWKRTWEKTLRRRLPRWAKAGAKRITGQTAPTMDVYVLAFRAYILSRMSRLLNDRLEIDEPPMRNDPLSRSVH
ncbi:MAG: asparagine synthase-related protein [Vicinamibacterales bacterium]